MCNVPESLSEYGQEQALHLQVSSGEHEQVVEVLAAVAAAEVQLQVQTPLAL